MICAFLCIWRRVYVIIFTVINPIKLLLVYNAAVANLIIKRFFENILEVFVFNGKHILSKKRYECVAM